MLLGILQTPHRFRTKRQRWTLGGLGIETYSSADQGYDEGQLQRSKKPVSIRGLNENCNHAFKGAAIIASTSLVRCKSSTRPCWPRRCRRMARLTESLTVKAETS